VRLVDGVLRTLDGQALVHLNDAAWLRALQGAGQAGRWHSRQQAVRRSKTRVGGRSEWIIEKGRKGWVVVATTACKDKAKERGCRQQVVQRAQAAQEATSATTAGRGAPGRQCLS